MNVIYGLISVYISFYCIKLNTIEQLLAEFNVSFHRKKMVSLKKSFTRIQLPFFVLFLFLFLLSYQSNFLCYFSSLITIHINFGRSSYLKYTCQTIRRNSLLWRCDNICYRLYAYHRKLPRSDSSVSVYMYVQRTDKQIESKTRLPIFDYHSTKSTNVINIVNSYNCCETNFELIRQYFLAFY